MPLEAISIETDQLRKTWTKAEQEWASRIIDEHFEAHDDWTNAFAEMNLIYKEDFLLPHGEEEQSGPFAAMVITSGDFYAAVGVLITGFAITNDEVILLIGQSDEDGHPVFFPIN
jgi:hypothetical protein